jgi:RNA polymerase sigma-70 factor (sigma-E family)
MEFNLTKPAVTPRTGGREDAAVHGAASAEREVTELYEARALEMIRLAHVILGDRQRAEDIVQEAFCGLYRRWGQLSDTANAVSYLRSCVLNGCRSAMRRRGRWSVRPGGEPPAATGEAVVSAEAAVLTLEERREVVAALRRLPRRQREALVLRFYLGLSADESAAAMGIAPGTVRSAISRGLESLHRMLEETS